MRPIVFLLAAALASSAASAADPGSAALAVFANKCAECHAPTLPKPRAGFGLVTDLARLSASPKYIVAGKPEDSLLWHEVEEGDMPPDKAQAGPLTLAEKETIRDWILSLASPEQRSTGAAAPDAPSIVSRESAPNAEVRSAAGRAWELLGRFHVVAVHFPIGLLLAASLTEAWALVRRRAAPADAMRLLLWLGAVSAIGAAAMGWVHAIGRVEVFGGGLFLHRWTGTAAAVAAVAVLVLVERDYRRGIRTRLACAAVVLLGALVGLAGHFGGLLTHGAGFFDP